MLRRTLRPQSQWSNWKDKLHAEQFFNRHSLYLKLSTSKMVVAEVISGKHLHKIKPVFAFKLHDKQRLRLVFSMGNLISLTVTVQKNSSELSMLRFQRMVCDRTQNTRCTGSGSSVAFCTGTFSCIFPALGTVRSSTRRLFRVSV